MQPEMKERQAYSGALFGGSMKNKKYVPFLAIAAIVVWGLIIYRVLTGQGGDDDQLIPDAPAKDQKEAYNDYAIIKDTTRLNLNYQDPFGQKKLVDTVSVKKPVIMAVKKSNLVGPVVNMEKIRYSGYIRNPQSKKLIAMISINGKMLSLAEGETTENLKLIKNLQDSVKISYSGKTTFLILKSGNL
jgi:hypothetical protein